MFDLLSNNRVPLRVRGGDQPYLENLSTMVVETFDEWNAVRVKGLSRRATAATLVNELSSRSHAIFRITYVGSFTHGKEIYTQALGSEWTTRAILRSSATSRSPTATSLTSPDVSGPPIRVVVKASV